MTDSGESPQETVPSVQHKRMLVGFMSPTSARNVLASRHGEDLPPPDEQYRQAQEAIEPLERPAEEFEVDPLPDQADVQAHIESFRESPDALALKEVIDGELEIGLAPIDGLVVFQTDVNTTAHRDVTTWESDKLALLERTLPIERDPLQFVNSLDSSERTRLGVQFTTRNPNVRVVEKQVEYNDDRSSATVSFEVRSKADFVHVVRFRDRLLLKNGCHRVYQLMRAGGTHVPAVISDAETYAETGGHHSRNFDEEVIMDERPPTVADYGRDAAIEVLRPAHNKVIRCLAETAWVPR